MSEAAAEEAIGTAALLAACGGFLDAFTYLGHGHVFANAMTGNVVLLGVAAATAQWSQSLHHLVPIVAFLLGVAVAQVFRPVTALALEVLFLLIGGFFPKGFAGMPLVLGISFLAALQSSTFRKAGRWTYSSTMTTGNLRTFGESVFRSISGAHDPDTNEKAKAFGVLCVAFLAGATAGGVCTVALDNHALWIADGLLLALWLRLAAARRRGY